MPYLDRGTARVYYELFPAAGSHRGWVTLVNGHARSSSDFRAFGKFLSENGISALTFDNRGAGKTSSPEFSFGEMLDDVEALWKEQRIDRTHLLGISYGGVISMNLASRSPNRVQSLVLASTTCESKYLGGRRLAELPLEERTVEMGKYFGSSFGEKNPVLFKSLVKTMAQGFEDPEFIASARQQRAALDSFDFRSKLPAIKCPCLILHGTDDKVIPAQSAQELHAAISDSVLELWDGVGHLFLAESPKRFYETSLDFFLANG